MGAERGVFWGRGGRPRLQCVAMRVFWRDWLRAFGVEDVLAWQCVEYLDRYESFV